MRRAKRQKSPSRIGKIAKLLILAIVSVHLYCGGISSASASPFLEPSPSTIDSPISRKTEREQNGEFRFENLKEGDYKNLSPPPPSSSSTPVFQSSFELESSSELELKRLEYSSEDVDPIQFTFDDPPQNLSVYYLPSSVNLFRPIFTTIDKENTHTHSFPVDPSVLEKWPAIQIQFYAETEERLIKPGEERSFPLFATAHWYGSIRSWEIPIHKVSKGEELGKVHRFSDSTIGQTLWTYPHKHYSNGSGAFNLTVQVSIPVEALVYYKIKVVALKSFSAPLAGSSIGKASPTSPAFFMFKFPPNPVDHYFIHVVSDSSICARMIVQQPRGPFLEAEEHSSELQFSETFTMKAGMTVRAFEFPKGMLLTFIPFENDSKCKSRKRFQTEEPEPEENDPFRMKTITFQIREGMQPDQYWEPTLVPIAVFVAFAIFVFCVLLVFESYKKKCIDKSVNMVDLIQRRRTCYQSNIMISDLILTEPSRVVDQTRRYWRAGFVTSAFYSVPVIQLILTFGKQLKETGNFDICYFNHFCSHRLGIVHDFNHMYSNIWYSLFGILYIAVVRVRQLSQANMKIDRGVMTHYGLLYCMGYALIMTGFMSKVYHICPNQSNFQFDTVFMYTIAAITTVTIYQSRHPTYLSANFTFTALALVTCITVLGLLWEQLLIRVVFSAVHLLFLILTLPKVCYNGYVRKNDCVVHHWYEVMGVLAIKLKDDWKTRRIFSVQQNVWEAPDEPDVKILPGPGRLILPGFLLSINCFAIAAMWTILLDQNFATQVLFICVVNGSLYSIFYSYLKLHHGECRRLLWVQPAMYILLSFGLWGMAISNFFDEVATWEASPAESKLKNTECLLLNFYDSHDLWHFLSAAALFCSAMVLLTVDDDLVDQPKSSIPVF